MDNESEKSATVNKEEIVREYVKVQNSIKAYALSVCGDFHLAEDICQEVAVKLLKRAEAYDPSRPFLPWALFITRCETVDYLKKHNKKNAMILSDDVANLVTETYLEIDSNEDIEERAMAMQGCLRKLSDQNLKIFKYKYVDKMSMKNIAAKFNRSFLSVQSLLNRLKEKLRKCIKSEMEISNEV